MKICSIKDCNKEHNAKEYCQKHYLRFKLHGDPFYTPYKETCIINECVKRHLSRGFCGKHYARWKKHGDPNKTEHRTQCEIKKCDKKHHAKGLCSLHWQKVNRKTNPEKIFWYNIKHLERYGKFFDMNPNEYSWALQSWGDTIKKMDNSICKNCDSTENLHAHHIQPKSLFPELALNLDNGITLCKPCHEEIHGFQTYKKHLLIPSLNRY